MSLGLNRVFFSPCEAFIIVASDKFVVVLDSETNEEFKKVEFDTLINDLYIAENYLVVAGKGLWPSFS